MFAIAWAAMTLGNPAVGLRAPEGFEVVEFVGAPLASDVYSMTIDRSGSLTAAGRGYIRTLIDENGDGRADRGVDFAAGPAYGAMGLLWDGDDLYASDDGGVVRYRDADRDGRADGPPEYVVRLKSGGEHGVHAIRRGPDGWFYVICGNESGVDARWAATPASPVQTPVAGCLLRFSPDWKTSEIVADGFRNAYDFDFNAAGDIFAFESDNERCVSLPWYEPTRFYHVVPGGRCGWQGPTRAQTWRAPPWFPDVVPPIALLGRGSPTGVVCYRHSQFPERYRGGFFALDWTFGRVWFVSVRASGASYAAEAEVFLEPKANNGLAPTDVVVDPATGDLFVCTGGRGTRGAVYRIRWTDGFRMNHANAPAQTPAVASGAATGEAIHAASNIESRLRRRLEELARSVEEGDSATLDEAVLSGLDHPDRLVRQAAARLESRRRRGGVRSLPDRRLGRSLVSLPHCIDAGMPPNLLMDRILESQEAFRITNSPDERVAYVRAAQRAIGDVIDPRERETVWAGYSIREPTGLVHLLPRAIFEVFPTGERAVDWEIIRLAAMSEWEDADFFHRLAGTPTPQSDPVDDIHVLIALARLPPSADPSVAHLLAEAMLRLAAKLDAPGRRIDRNWPLRMREMHRELAGKYPGLNSAMVASRQFGREAHMVWTAAEGFDRRRAAEIFVDRAERDPDWTWTPEMIEAASELPWDRAAAILRGRWDHISLRGPIVRQLARRPEAEDRERFLGWLSQGAGEAREEALKGLESIGVERGRESALRIRTALRRAPAADGRSQQARLAALLAQALDIPPPSADIDGWLAERVEPALGGAAAEDSESRTAAQWRERLQSVNWEAGDPVRGGAAYQRLGCRQCHGGGQASGPDLAGVARRFTHDDLVAAVVDPGRDIPDRYRTTTIATRSGKTYFGIIVYEAADSCLMLLQTGETVRIDPDDVEERRRETASLMPSGLLDSASDEEIADLFAYLGSLDRDGSP